MNLAKLRRSQQQLLNLLGQSLDQCPDCPHLKQVSEEATAPPVAEPGFVGELYVWY